MEDTQPARVRFRGFDFDLQTGELRTNGQTVRLSDKPLRVLVILVEHAGELVTRDQIQKKLWPGDTFVDFEHGINNTIKLVRQALGDSADDPKYIETIPRRGYRLLAAVEPVETHDPINMPFLVSSVAAPVLTADNVVLSKARKIWRYGWKLPLVLAILLVCAGAAAVISWRSHRAIRLTDKDTVLLAEFENRTGDPVFDDTLKTALTVALSQSPFLDILGEGRIAATLTWMTRRADTRLTPEVARELCQRANSKAYIAGSISRMGQEYVIALKAVNCQTGDTLAEEQVSASAKEQVLNALGGAASRLRARLGESLATVQKFDVPLPEATTSSLEALKAASLGIEVFHNRGPSAALPYFQRAVQLDPEFADVYEVMGKSYGNLSQVGRAREYYTKAFQLRGRVTEREQLAITVVYYEKVTGELERAARTCQEMIASYPRNASAYANLGEIYYRLGQHEKAVEAQKERQRLRADAYGPIMPSLALQRFDEVRRILREAESRKADTRTFHFVRYGLAFVTSNSTELQRQQQWFAASPENANFGLSLTSDTEAYAGHLLNARELTRRAAENAVQIDNTETAAIWWENAALREAAYGNFPEARRAAAAGLKLDANSPAVRVEAALAYAMAGDSARAESLARELDQNYPLDTQMQSLWLPAIRAQLALRHRSAPAAIEDLRKALPPMEYAGIEFPANISCLYPTYIRGQAYLAAGQGKSAASEFQKIVDHSAIVWNCWTGALARLGLARANALQGNDAGSRLRTRTAYEDFLTLWKGADPEIPIYKRAKFEYAKLE